MDNPLDKFRQDLHHRLIAPPELFMVVHADGERCYWVREGNAGPTSVAESLEEAKVVMQRQPWESHEPPCGLHCGPNCGPHTLVRYVKV